jgi:hypothetical protein
MNTLTQSKDKFGYYTVGNFKTYSKVEAIELHKITGIHPHWDFNEAEFSRHDWTKEPLESLEELYARRARQLRADYDHVVIFYSGGADSNNIVNTFIKNNLVIDEIATYTYYEAESNPNSFFNSELTKVAYPQIEKWQEQGVRFKHRDIDLSQITFNIVNDSHYDTNRAYYANHAFSNNNLARSYIRENEPDYQKLINQGKRLVFVWGTDKPRIYKENGRFCIKFLDVVDGSISNRTQLLNREWEHDELFYWAPEAADIVCKQGHILKRFIEKHNLFCNGNNYSDYRSEEKISLHKDNPTDSELNFRNLINTLMYSEFDPGMFTVGKPYSRIESPRDTVFFKDIVFRKQLENLMSHLSQLDPYWLNDSNNIHKGLKLCISPAYYLE